MHSTLVPDWPPFAYAGSLGDAAITGKQSRCSQCGFSPTAIFQKSPSVITKVRITSQLLQTLNKLNQKKQDYLLGGDCNIDLLKQGIKPNICNYQTAVCSEGCTTLIYKATGITESSATLIDHIYANASNNIVRRGILTFEISDHMPIFCTLSLNPAINTQITLIRDMKNLSRKVS